MSKGQQKKLLKEQEKAKRKAEAAAKQVMYYCSESEVFFHDEVDDDVCVSDCHQAQEAAARDAEVGFCDEGLLSELFFFQC